MDDGAIQAVHSLIDDLQEAAADLPDPADIEADAGGDEGGDGGDPAGDGADSGADSSDGQNQIQASQVFTAEIEAQDEPQADTDGLKGIIWASGTHSLWVNGEPTEVFVPEDTISATFERLQQRMEAGEPPKIGFDHPDEDSVAAQTALGEIGIAQDFVQASEGGREVIAMQDSEFTNNKAVEAAEAGGFDGMGFSIVGNIAIQQDEDGNPMRNDDGALQVAATEIQRIDVVPDQAVKGAKNGNLPEMAAAAEAGRLAASSPNQSAQGFVRTLRAAAGTEADADANDTMTDTDQDIPTDPDSLEAAQNALSQASDVVEAKEEKIEDLQSEVADLEAQASHFQEIAASHGIDLGDDDVEAQDVVDAHTEDLREEIAELEAALPKYDLESEDTEDRTEELAGSSISELEAMAGNRWREFGKAQAKQEDLGSAVAAGESLGGVESASGSDSDASDEAAQEVLTARELMQASDSDQSPAEFVEATYGVDPSDYSSPQELQAKISGGAN